MSKILNLYCGIGGNRHLWGNNHQITAVEINEEIAKEYKKKFPDDEVIICDAHEYLKNNYKNYEIIWTSPPCPTHSRMRLNHKVKVYPDMTLYQEILFLKHFCKNKIWVVENVIPYYEPLIKPTQKIGRHLFWSNKNIKSFDLPSRNVAKVNKEILSDYHKIPIPECRNARLCLRNCVNPKLALHILRGFESG